LAGRHVRPPQDTHRNGRGHPSSIGRSDLKAAPATTESRGVHRFAVFTACATLLLIVAGALVTSNDAGLSVPDWPTSFGSLYKIPKLVGGVKFEHVHRMIAQFVGVLTIVLALWTWRADHRRWMKYLGVAALGTVVAQGVLGGLTVLFYLPPAISSAHAALAQTFFCIAVSIALFTGREWKEQALPNRGDNQHPQLFTLAVLSILVLYIQLILGAMFRHRGMGWLPHLLNAPLVAAILAWTAIRARRSYAEISAIRRPATLMLWLVGIQLCLGFAAFETRVVWGHDAVQPELPMVVSTVGHVAIGAILLAVSVVLAIQVRRQIPTPARARIASAERKPIAA
jgi:heme a synthase